MTFNPTRDKIAVTVARFQLLKSSEGPFEKYNEPYIVSMAVDNSGVANPGIDFNLMPFPKVRPGGTVTMLGDGHLVYGPRNPGEFVALSVLLAESDEDVRLRGTLMQEFVQSKAVELGIKALLAANPGYGAIVGALKELAVFLAAWLEKNGDDLLFRFEGSFLRDHPVPYHVNRSYQLGNDYASVDLKVLPLIESNGQGPTPKRLTI